MTFEGALRARLLAMASIAAAVGTRVYLVNREQGAPIPDITLTPIFPSRDRHMKGFQSLQFVRVQVDPRATTYLAAKAIAEQIIAEMAMPETSNGIYFRGAEVRGPRPTIEPVPNGVVHRHGFDLIIPFSNA